MSLEGEIAILEIIKVTGVWEKEPGSGIWWIRHRQNGDLHREEVGLKSDAIALYRATPLRVERGPP